MFGRPAAALPSGGRLLLRPCLQGGHSGSRGGLVVRGLVTTVTTVTTATTTTRRPRPARMAALPSLALATTTEPIQHSSLLPWVPRETRRHASKRARSPTARRVARGLAPVQSSPAAGSGPRDLTRLNNAIEAIRGEIDDFVEAADCPFTGDECMEIYEKYRDILALGVRPSETSLLRDYDLTPYKLHMAAVALIHGVNWASDSFGVHIMIRGLMDLASKTPTQPGGYMPSTLSILRMFGHGLRDERATKDAYLTSAKERFLAYMGKHRTPLQVSSSATEQPSSTAGGRRNIGGGDRVVSEQDVVIQADAFTLAGILAEQDDRPDLAMSWYRAARTVGEALPPVYLSDEATSATAAAAADMQSQMDSDTVPRANKWDWERVCLEGIVRLQEQQQKAKTKAVAVGSLADDPEAWSAAQTAVLALGSKQARTALGIAIVEQSSSSSSSSNKGGEPSGSTTAQKGEEMLRQAAASGAFEACEALANLHSLKAAAAVSKEDAAEHEKMAEEWSLVWEEYEKVNALAG